MAANDAEKRIAELEARVKAAEEEAELARRYGGDRTDNQRALSQRQDAEAVRRRQKKAAAERARYAERKEKAAALVALAKGMESADIARVYFDRRRARPDSAGAYLCPSCGAAVPHARGYLESVIEELGIGHRHPRRGDPEFWREHIFELAARFGTFPWLQQSVPCSSCGAPILVTIILVPE